MASVARGDHEALRALFEATRARLFGLALSILGRPDLAEEVVTDAYVRAWRNAVRYEPEKGSVLAWLGTITRRRAIDRLRESRSDLQPWPDHEWNDVSAPAPTPLQASLADEEIRSLRLALQGLSEDQRRAIEVTFFEGLSHTQAAAFLGHPLGTVKSRIRSGLTAIRHKLEFEEEGAA